MSTLSAPAAAPGSPSALKSHCRSIAERARTAAIDLAGVPGQTKAACLRAAAAAIRADVAEILAANKLDLAAAPGFGLTAAAIDRLVHHSIILELDCKSYRAEHEKNKRQKGDN